MQVTQILDSTKNKKRIFLDDEFAFVLYKGELHKYGIVLGEELPDDVYNEIVRELLPKRAKLRAMNLLQSKDYTTRQLRDKLLKGEYPEEIVDEAIEYVSSYHYLDDLRYATDYITYHEKDMSLLKIKMNLANRGIGKETLDRAIMDWKEQGGNQEESDMINKLLVKKNYSVDWEYKDKCKLYQYLLRKGFSADSIQKTLNMHEIF